LLLYASEEAVDPKRIADAENIIRSVAIEANSDVKVDLVMIVDAVAAAGIEQ
jgi:hypothetical protein